MSDSVRPHGQQTTRLLLSKRVSRQEYWSGLRFPSPKLKNKSIQTFHWLKLSQVEHISLDMESKTE